MIPLLYFHSLQPRVSGCVILIVLIAIVLVNGRILKQCRWTPTVVIVIVVDIVVVAIDPSRRFHERAGFLTFREDYNPVWDRRGREGPWEVVRATMEGGHGVGTTPGTLTSGCGRDRRSWRCE